MAENDDEGMDGERGRRAAAFGVHVFTALGAGLGFLALLAAVEGRWSVMFAWLVVALLVDGVDGFLARKLDVRRRAARWSGDILDLVVDILTWVLVPTYAIVAAGLLPPIVATLLGIAIMVTSVIYFADTHMKGPENYFYGFPGAWNVVAFFLFLLGMNPWVNAAVVVALCVLTFVPVPFVHPFRVERGRALTLVALLGGTVLAGIALWRNLAPGVEVTTALCAIGLYFLFIGMMGRLKAV